MNTNDFIVMLADPSPKLGSMPSHQQVAKVEIVDMTPDFMKPMTGWGEAAKSPKLGCRSRKTGTIRVSKPYQRIMEDHKPLMLTSGK